MTFVNVNMNVGILCFKRRNLPTESLAPDLEGNTSAFEILQVIVIPGVQGKSEDLYEKDSAS